MKLVIQQKVFSLHERFQVMDETGEPLYEVKGKALSIGHKLTVTDMRGEEVAYIHQKVMSLVPKYFIEMAGRAEVELKGHITLLRPHYTLEMPDGDWEIRGSFTQHDYTMTCGDETVATVAQAWFAWGDTYALEVANDADALTALCVLLAIDCVNSDTTVAAGATAGTVAAHAAASHSDKN